MNRLVLLSSGALIARMLASTHAAAATPNSTAHPDPKQSYFRMKRVDSTTSCTDILKQQAELF